MLVSIFSSLLLSLSATAAPSNVVIQTKATVDLHQFSCQTHILDGRTVTQVGRAQDRTVVHSKDIEVIHPLISVQGCDLAKLQLVSQEAEMSFGFLHNRNVTVTKVNGESFRNGNGECVSVFREILDVELGPSIVLHSFEGEMRKQTDCL